MAQYCVNKSGDHEVHKMAGCSYIPDEQNRIGFYADTDFKAMQKAKEYYSSVDGCYYCMNAYHKK